MRLTFPGYLQRNVIRNNNGEIKMHAINEDGTIGTTFFGQENKKEEYKEMYRAADIRIAKEYPGNGKWIALSKRIPAWPYATNEMMPVVGSMNMTNYLDAVIVNGQEIQLLDQAVYIIKP